MNEIRTNMHPLRLIPALGLAAIALAAPPAVDMPAGGVEVLEAIPFRCEVAWTHHWSAERPEVSAGTILVARVDPEAIRPKAAAGPVLMVGEEIAEIVNPGNVDGIVIAVVPAPAGWDVTRAATLAGREVFLSGPGLPDQIDATARTARREAARTDGVAPQPATRPATVRTLADREALDRDLASIVRRRCPGQSRLADLLDGSIGDREPRPAAE
jgi:hypothetical protein